jgi:hypothetical protein
MKKFLVLAICFQLTGFPALAGNFINDDLVDKTLQNKNLVINNYHSDNIEDFWAEETLKNIKINNVSKPVPINDDLVDKTLQNAKIQEPKSNSTPIEDKFAETSLKNCAPLVIRKTNYDFSLAKRTPIKISIINPISTKQSLKEGQSLVFRVVNDVKLNDKYTLKKDTLINGKLETISPNQAFGVPADIIIDDFELENNKDKIILDGSIHKIGANRSLWVYPVGYMGCCFFGVGLLVFAIRGGHAKIKTNDILEVYWLQEKT